MHEDIKSRNGDLSDTVESPHHRSQQALAQGVTEQTGMVEAPELNSRAERRYTLVIDASQGGIGLQWSELWRYRELAGFLAWRDIKLRYRQTGLGVAWALLQPLLPVAVFTVFFGRLAGFADRTDGNPYALYVLAAFLPWLFFANAITGATNCLVNSPFLVTKVYFPRIIVPLGTMAACFVDFLVGAAALVVLLVWYGIVPTWHLLLLPVFLLGLILLAAGVGFFLAALTVAYRDFRFVVPFVVQVWMFVTPVVYPASLVPERWRTVYGINAMAGLVDGFRSASLGFTPHWPQVLVSLALCPVAFFAGLAYFQKVERGFADVI